MEAPETKRRSELNARNFEAYTAVLELKLGRLVEDLVALRSDMERLRKLLHEGNGRLSLTAQVQNHERFNETIKKVVIALVIAVLWALIAPVLQHDTADHSKELRILQDRMERMERGRTGVGGW